MGKFTITHEINCDVDTFWKLFFDKTFNEALFRESLQFPKYDVLDHRETDTEIVRKVHGMPKMDVPGPVAKLLGSSFSYTEEGRLDKKTHVWSWKMIPSSMADKMRNEGSMRVEAAGPGKCRRVAELLIEAKVFGLGGVIEGAAEKNLRDGWNKSATFMNQWLASGKGPK
jgi:hypothetical protein